MKIFYLCLLQNAALYQSIVVEVLHSNLRLLVNTGFDVGEITIALQPRSTGQIQEQVRQRLSLVDK